MPNDRAEIERLQAERKRLDRLLSVICCWVDEEEPLSVIWAAALVLGINLERPAHLDEGPFVARDGFAWAETEDGRFARIALVDDV